MQVYDEVAQVAGTAAASRTPPTTAAHTASAGQALDHGSKATNVARIQAAVEGAVVDVLGAPLPDSTPLMAGGYELAV